MATVIVEAAARDLVVSVVQQHADSLLRTARRYTACAADAEDAYQRALEIFVKNAGRLEADGAHRWLHVVVRNEALAVRRGRSTLVGVEDEAALDALDDARHVASVEERSERLDDLGRAAEALQRLKPQEVTALWLKAEGLSYEEIAERQGWTYTKVNRCLTEGRRAFLRRYAGIEAGEECERWASVLSAVADGEATPRQLLEARPHLRTADGSPRRGRRSRTPSTTGRRASPRPFTTAPPRPPRGSTRAAAQDLRPGRGSRGFGRRAGRRRRGRRAWFRRWRCSGRRRAGARCGRGSDERGSVRAEPAAVGRPRLRRVEGGGGDGGVRSGGRRGRARRGRRSRGRAAAAHGSCRCRLRARGGRGR